MEDTRELGVEYLSKEGPVLLMKPIEIEKSDMLDWKKKSLKAVVDIAGSNESLKELIMWASYSQIPLCNLSRGA